MRSREGGGDQGGDGSDDQGSDGSDDQGGDGSGDQDSSGDQTAVPSTQPALWHQIWTQIPFGATAPAEGAFSQPRALERLNA